MAPVEVNVVIKKCTIVHGSRLTAPGSDNRYGSAFPGRQHSVRLHSYEIGVVLFIKLLNADRRVHSTKTECIDQRSTRPGITNRPCSRLSMKSKNVGILPDELVRCLHAMNRREALMLHA